MVSVADKVPLPGMENKDLNKLVPTKESQDLPKDTHTDGVTRVEQEPIPNTTPINKEQQLYTKLKTATIKTAAEKALFDRLQAKYEPQPKKTIEEEALSIVKESETNPNLTIKTDADLFTELQKRGFSLNDILAYFSK
jgi:hypothetical protein